MDDSKKKRALQLWLEQELRERFDGRILGIDSSVALEWGGLQSSSVRSGNPVPVIDSLIAATAICHNLKLVTQNTTDFERMPVKLLNPRLPK